MARGNFGPSSGLDDQFAVSPNSGFGGLVPPESDVDAPGDGVGLGGQGGGSPQAPQGGEPSGPGQGRGPGGEGGSGCGGGGERLDIAALLETVLNEGGVTADENDADALAARLEQVQEVIDAGGTALPGHDEARLDRLSDVLDRIAEDGLPNERGALRILDGLSRFLDKNADDLSDEAVAALSEAHTLLSSVLDDGVLDEGDAATVEAADALIEQVAAEDYVILSDDGLADLNEHAADLATLLADGFLSFDEAELAAIETLLETVEAVGDQPDDAGRETLKEAFDLADDTVDLGLILAPRQGGPGHGGGPTGHGRGPGGNLGDGHGPGESGDPPGDDPYDDGGGDDPPGDDIGLTGGAVPTDDDLSFL